MTNLFIAIMTYRSQDDTVKADTFSMIIVHALLALLSEHFFPSFCEYIKEIECVLLC